MYRSRGIYGTEITELGHCLGIGKEGEEGVRGNFYVSVIELKLMSLPERVAHRP